MGDGAVAGPEEAGAAVQHMALEVVVGKPVARAASRQRTLHRDVCAAVVGGTQGAAIEDLGTAFPRMNAGEDQRLQIGDGAELLLPQDEDVLHMRRTRAHLGAIPDAPQAAHGEGHIRRPVIAEFIEEAHTPETIVEIVAANAEVIVLHARAGHDHDPAHGVRWVTGTPVSAARRAATRPRWQASGVRSTQKRTGRWTVSRSAISASQSNESMVRCVYARAKASLSSARSRRGWPDASSAWRWKARVSSSGARSRTCR